MPNYDDPPARLARVQLLGPTIRCCDPQHNVELDGLDQAWDVLNWIRYGSGWGRPWITRIRGNSANGYEYTCCRCTDRTMLAERMVWDTAAGEWTLLPT